MPIIFLLLLHLVEQHGVDEVVVDGLGLAGLWVVLHKIRIDLGHLFGDKAVLQCARPFGVFGLVMEGDGPEFHKAAARISHILDVFFVPARGVLRAELAVRSPQIPHFRREAVVAVYTGNIGLRSECRDADPDRVGFGLTMPVLHHNRYKCC